MERVLNRSLPLPLQTVAGADADRFAAFQARYFDDPVAFARDCIDWRESAGLAPYQERVLASLVDSRRVTVVGPHGLGKTMLMAISVHWFALTRSGQDWKLPTTASVWRQLEQFLWPEIHKWAGRIRWDVVGREPYLESVELLDLSLQLDGGSAFALASDKPSAIEGAHADHIYYLFDEAKAIPTATFVAAEGAFSTSPTAMALATSTPGDSAGRFWELHAHRDKFAAWRVLAVTLDECIAAGRITRDWADQMLHELGESNPEYVRRVLGQFAMADSPDGVIPRKWVKLAQMRWKLFMQDVDAGRRSLPPVSGLAVDVGGESTEGDATVFATRRAGMLDPLEVSHGRDPMAIAAEARVRFVRTKGFVRVDSIGIGAGVVSRVRQLGVKTAEAWNAAERVEKTDKTKLLRFVNQRAYAWWRFRELLDPVDGEGLMLPEDKELEDELCAPSWTHDETDKIVVESKKAVRKRIGRSTDRADAAIMAFVPSSGVVRPSVPGDQRVSAPVG